MTAFTLFEKLARTTTPRLPRRDLAADTPFVTASGAFRFDALLSKQPLRALPATLTVLETAFSAHETTPGIHRHLRFLRAARPTQYSSVTHAAVLGRLATHLLRDGIDSARDGDEHHIAAANALALAAVLDPCPTHVRALVGILADAGNAPLECLAAYVPALTWLGQRLDVRGTARHDVRCWMLAAEAGIAPETNSRIDELLDGIAMTATVTKLIAVALPAFSRPDVVEWIALATEWTLQAIRLLPDSTMLSERTRELGDALDALSADLAGNPDWFFGIPLQAPLPHIRLLDYLQPPKARENRIFARGAFALNVLARCADGPLAAWTMDQPALADTIATAGGDTADFFALGESWYDRIDAMRSEEASAGSPAYSTGDAFLYALTCRVFATTRQQDVESATDLQHLLRRCAAEVEQPPGVDVNDAAWVALAMRPAIDAALRHQAGEPPLATWLRTLQEGGEPSAIAEARVRVRAALFGARGILQLLRRRHRAICNLAGPIWRHRARREMVALLTDAADIATTIANANLIPREDRKLARGARTLSKLLCSHHYCDAPPIAPSQNASVTGTPTPPTALSKRPTAAPPAPTFVQVVSAEALESASLRKQIQENWSLNKAERLAEELRCCTSNPDAVTSLAREFPWMATVVARIARRIEAAQRLGYAAFRMPPLLLVGHHGCGKTRFAQRLAEVQGLPWRLLAAGGSTDNRALAGTARGWSSAYPSLPVDFMGETGVANGLIVIDEIDKESDSRHNGRLTDTLLQLMEPANARRFDDIFLGMPVDCSALNWILTANSLGSIQPAILSRVEVMYVPQPGPANFPAIAAAVRDEFARRHAVDPRVLPPFTGEDLDYLQACCRSARDVRRAAEEIVSNRLATEHHHSTPN